MTREESEKVGRNGRSWMIPMLAVVLLTTVVFADILFLGRGPFERDLTTLHFAQKKVVRDAMLSGEFPGWNPRVSGGQPMAANPQYEVFYPGQLPILIPDYYLGYRIHLVLHYFVAALGMLYLGRALGLSTKASLLGAIAFGLGGPLLSLMRVPPFLAAYSWTPWVFLVARRFIRSGGSGNLFIVALVGGVQALVGEPMMLLQTWIIVGGYGCWKWHESRGEDGSSKLIFRALAVPVVAGLVGAVQLLPAADFARDGVRARGFSFERAAHWSMPFERLEELAIPGSNRVLIGEGGEPARQRLYPNGDPFVRELHVGLFVALLAIAGFVRRRRGWMIAGGATLFFGVLAMGQHTPLFRLLFDVGIAKSLRYPEKFVLGVVFVLIVWAMFEADKLFDGDFSGRGVVLWLAGLLGVFSFVRAIGAGAPDGLTRELWPGELLLSGRGYWFGIAVLAAAVFTGVKLLSGKSRSREIAGWSLVALTAVQLAVLRPSVLPTKSADFFARPAVISDVSPAGGRMVHLADWQWADGDRNALALFAPQSTYADVFRNGAFPTLPTAWDIDLAYEDDYDSTSFIWTDELRSAFNEVRRSGDQRALAAFLDLADVEWVTTLGDSPSVDTPVAIHRRERPGRAIVPDRVEVGGMTELIANARSGRSVVLREGEPFVPGAAVVESLELGWSRIAFQVRADADTYVLVRQTWHRYWNALIDGENVNVDRANVAFMGVAVPAGMHTVTLKYKNPAVLLGGVMSLIALAVLGVLWFRERRLMT